MGLPGIELKVSTINQHRSVSLGENEDLEAFVEAGEDNDTLLSSQRTTTYDCGSQKNVARYQHFNVNEVRVSPFENNIQDTSILFS
ncbi:unnamed protein product [Phytophthora lilii]|uniref:Unnamed protein product n=1 Tax=Phytophthora lilii TaxID=2077276 RepID=A0A9W6WU34_9STRA|nr:unnamed protein product [Phytophthora lilii]